MSKSPVVAVEGLVKSYGDLRAVVDVNFEVDRGEVFALLGPNGAGKTTTIEILEGFRSRDQGKVQVLGFDPADRRTSRQMRELLGVVLEEFGCRAVPVRPAGADAPGGLLFPRPRPVDEVLELVGLGDKSRDRVKTLSGGQQRRLDLAVGIIGDPELLILDEPTTGFDPSARRGAWEPSEPWRTGERRSSSLPTTWTKPRRWPTGGGDQRWTHRC